VFTRPIDVSDADVAGVLRAAWSMRVDSIAYAAVGFGSHHWTVTAAGDRRFVTIDAATTGDDCGGGAVPASQQLHAALLTARRLHDAGLAWVVAPVVSTQGHVIEALDDRYLLAVYPHIDGASHEWGPFTDEAERVAVLERLVALDTAPAHAIRSARVDRMDIPCREYLETSITHTAEPWTGGPFAEPMRQLLRHHARSIAVRLEGYDQLARHVDNEPTVFVATHGELHRGNTMTTSSGVVIVDWDTMLLAPPERDVWWLAREDPNTIADYQRATGVALDLEVLQMYESRWDLTDLALFVAQLRARHEDTADTRTAWQALAGCLDHPAN
jgi:hypothetical protein